MHLLSFKQTSLGEIKAQPFNKATVTLLNFKNWPYIVRNENKSIFKSLKLVEVPTNVKTKIKSKNYEKIQHKLC